MPDVTRILNEIEQGDMSAAEQLLPLVYDELRRLASAKMAQEAPGQTLQATALVHEAYVKLVGGQNGRSYRDRRHFFTAAATAMRRILVDRVRSKRSLKRATNSRDRASLEETNSRDRASLEGLTGRSNDEAKVPQQFGAKCSVPAN